MSKNQMVLFNKDNTKILVIIQRLYPYQKEFEDILKSYKGTINYEEYMQVQYFIKYLNSLQGTYEKNNLIEYIYYLLWHKFGNKIMNYDKLKIGYNLSLPKGNMEGSNHGNVNSNICRELKEETNDDISCNKNVKSINNRNGNPIVTSIYQNNYYLYKYNSGKENDIFGNEHKDKNKVVPNYTGPIFEKYNSYQNNFESLGYYFLTINEIHNLFTKSNSGLKILNKKK